MTLRHIKPRTPEWQDALEPKGKGFAEEGFLGHPGLNAEDLYKLRQILAMEQALMGMPSPWAANNRNAA